MKRNILFSAAALIAACTISISVQAQLEVQTSGNVVASKNLKVDQNVAVGTTVDNQVSLKIDHKSTSQYPYYGIWTRIRANSSAPYASIYGISSFADAANATVDFPNITQIVGVFGKASKPSEISSRFSAGVAGMANYYQGIGVYGAIGNGGDMQLPTTSMGGTYAGYFDGTVGVNGTLFATNISVPSSMQMRDNVEQLSSSITDNLLLLKPVSYTLQQDSTWKYDMEAKELQGVHYGLIAQEVQKIYPELVYERGDKLSINYIELIPLLIMKVQELSAEVEKLKANPKGKTLSYKKNSTDEETIDAVLYQNNPNPFTEVTKVEYQLPQTTQSATLYIYNMNGLQVAEYPILTFGNGYVSVSAGALDAGMYLYSLVADGQVIDTKRMILTK